MADANKRKTPNLRTKLAAALLQIKDGDGKPLISWAHAQLLSAEQINSLFQFDHYPIRHEAGGPAEPWNLVPRLIPDHRIKTAKFDVPQVAKARRISKAQEEFRARLLTPRDERQAKPSKWPKRKLRTLDDAIGKLTPVRQQKIAHRARQLIDKRHGPSSKVTEDL